VHATVLLQRQVQLVLQQTIDKAIVMLISKQTHAFIHHPCIHSFIECVFPQRQVHTVLSSSLYEVLSWQSARTDKCNPHTLSHNTSLLKIVEPVTVFLPCKRHANASHGSCDTQTTTCRRERGFVRAATTAIRNSSERSGIALGVSV